MEHEETYLQLFPLQLSAAVVSRPAVFFFLFPVDREEGLMLFGRELLGIDKTLLLRRSKNCVISWGLAASATALNGSGCHGDTCLLSNMRALGAAHHKLGLGEREGEGWRRGRQRRVEGWRWSGWMIDTWESTVLRTAHSCKPEPPMSHRAISRHTEYTAVRCYVMQYYILFADELALHVTECNWVTDWLSDWLIDWQTDRLTE